MHFSLSSFATLAVAAGAVAAQPSRRAGNLDFNPPASLVKHIDWSALPPAPTEPVTNAKRFAQGLPPMNPAKRHPHRGGPHRDSSSHHGGTRVASAPRAQSSPSPPVDQKCNLLASNTNGTTYGYIGPVWNDFGEYGTFQPSQDGALEVSFSYSPDSPSQLAFVATNGPSAAYPFFGGIMGYGSTDTDFGQGNYNYAYLGGTTRTSPGSPAVGGPNSYTTATGLDTSIESAIWIFDPSTYAITAQWVNADKSAPATSIIHTQGVLALTGDPNAFADALGPADTLIFKCVPLKVTPARV